MNSDLKVVITQRYDRTAVGVQAEGCDPVVTVLPITLEEALARIPGLIAEARAQWEQSPRYPKSARAIPVAPVRTPAPARSVANKPVPKKTESQPQSKLF